MTPTCVECPGCSYRLLCACEQDACVCAQNAFYKAHSVCDNCAFDRWLDDGGCEAFTTDDEDTRCREALAMRCDYCDRDGGCGCHMRYTR